MILNRRDVCSDLLAPPGRGVNEIHRQSLQPYYYRRRKMLLWSKRGCINSALVTTTAPQLN
ncbi:unnamed protein product [Coffea canephora]|uniref:Uncharacterized protein n=1 Tax=Coffea canephora TaxID=49390 RepID=A0A068UUR1_COFCA|nr:unnamed protein product [Coffea canephora]